MTDYSSLEEVLRAVRDLPYEGGSRRTGGALQFLVDHVFSAAISRDHASKVRNLVKYVTKCGDINTQERTLRLVFPAGTLV